MQIIKITGKPSPVKTVTLVCYYEIRSMRIGIVCYPTFGGSGVLATELGKAWRKKVIRFILLPTSNR